MNRGMARRFRGITGAILNDDRRRYLSHPYAEYYFNHITGCSCVEAYFDVANLEHHLPKPEQAIVKVSKLQKSLSTIVML